MPRQPNTTAKDMIASGSWAKVGPKRYRHESGGEIGYDHDRFAWSACGRLYDTLWLARLVFEESLSKETAR